MPSFKVRNTPKGWLLNVPKGLSDTGVKQRRYFRTRELANEAAQELRKSFRDHGEKASVLPPRVAGDAFAAWQLLEPHGITLLEAAKRVTREIERAALSAGVDEAATAFCLAKEHQSEKQVAFNEKMKLLLTKRFGSRKMVTITPEELVEFLEGITSAPASYNQWIRVVSAFWRWCAKSPRRWCDETVVNGLERKEVRSGDIGVLTFQEAEKLMRTAERMYPDAVHMFAIALFTGMRWKEIERLDPEDITPEGINLPATSAKTNRRRFIQMNAQLKAWLKAYPVGETVLPANWRRKERAVRRFAGWKIWSEAANPASPPDDLPEWPDNALRHTSASVSVALGKPLETLIFEHGHSGGMETMRRHYIGRMPRSEAKKIAALRPLPASGRAG